MADANHIDDFPEQSDISDFLRSLSPRPEGLLEGGLRYNTVEKWYRDPPAEMSAVNLLRVIKRLGKEQQLAEWLKSFRRLRRARVAEPTPGVRSNAAAGAKGGKRRPA